MHSSKGETPFKLVYDTNAMIPVEVMEPTLRMETLEEDNNTNERRVDLDLLPDVREAAHVHEFACKLRAEKKYNSRVVPRKLKEGDLVLRRTIRDASSNKLTPNWDGPFCVREEVGRGAFKSEELGGRQVPRTWNLTNLRFYYS
ncbi:hypothetical protein SESBI_31300 [Sesbania bispinosa]|nr:hypothetical protein SESBI_31300 [Sesbania bispinosa]